MHIIWRFDFRGVRIVGMRGREGVCGHVDRVGPRRGTSCLVGGRLVVLTRGVLREIGLGEW